MSCEVEAFKALAANLDDSTLSQLIKLFDHNEQVYEKFSLTESVKIFTDPPNMSPSTSEDSSCCGCGGIEPCKCMDGLPGLESLEVEMDDSNGEFVRQQQQDRDDAARYDKQLDAVLVSIEKYKSFLVSLLNEIDSKIESYNFLCRQLLLDTTLCKKVLNPRTLIGIPPFVDLEGFQPPVNEDVVRFNELKHHVPVYHSVKHWSKEEIAALRDGAWNLSRVLEILKLFDNCRLGNLRLSEDDKERFEQELKHKISITGYQCIYNGQLQIDWDILAKNFVPSRSGFECKIRWFVEEDPRINKSEWSTEETKKLLEVAQKYSCRDWVQICKDLGTNRTPMQCFQRYQRSHNASIIKQEFTADEDEKLLELVPKYGFNWEQIAIYMPGRTASQCNHRYNNSAIQSIRSGRWTSEEDVRLILAKKAFDKWTYIADYVPGRTGMKCRERYANVLDPLSHRSKNRHWTEEEDTKLFQLVREYGAGNWSKISEIMGDRTDNQCYRRWKNTASKYCPDELDEYRKKLNLKRKLVLNNFVGRKQNRPKIDLEALEEIVSPLESTISKETDDDSETNLSSDPVSYDLSEE
jgi:hypothetical protein